MANWFCSVSNVVCVVNVCRSELIDSAWVVIVPGQKGINNKKIIIIIIRPKSIEMWDISYIPISNLYYSF